MSSPRYNHFASVVGLACFMVAAVVAAGGSAQADDSELVTGGAATAAVLARNAAQLGAGDAELRRLAYDTLTQLGPMALPALRARLSTLATVRPTHDEALRALSVFRHAAGSHRADDDTDLARGVLPALAQERSPALLAMAEPLLYMRALEAADDTDMQLELARYASLDDGAWLTELSLARKRRGAALLPAWIAMRSHESAAARRFAQASVTALGMEDPKDALSVQDPYLLARMLRAFANPPDFAAMPLVTRLVSDPRIEVRQAARFALAHYGKNAIWQVRELYEEVSGQPADKAWDAGRSSRELYQVLDRPALEDAATLLARGQERLAAHDLASMQRDYDTLLAKYPDAEDKPKLAPGYAAIGGARFAADDLEGALAAFQRAVRLGPQAQDAKRWRAQVAYVSAELALAQGVVDLAAYARALELDPTLSAARETKDRLSGEKTRRIRAAKRWAAAGALGLLLALAGFALRMRSNTGARPQNDESAEPA